MVIMILNIMNETTFSKKMIFGIIIYAYKTKSEKLL